MRTILIIIGVVVVLRILGRVMIAKRNLDEHERLEREHRKAEQERMQAKQNFGRTTISKVDKNKLGDGDFVEFEEIEE